MKEGEKPMQDGCIQKECDIIRRLDETGCRDFGGSREDALGCLTQYLARIREYAHAVMERQIRMAFPQAGSPALPEPDYNGAKDAIIRLNSLCASLSLPAFAGIDTDSPQAVREFIGRYVRETYRAGLAAHGAESDPGTGQ